MKLALADCKYLKDSISIISGLITEARIHVTKDGLSLIAMDAANVAMVKYQLLPTMFTEYKVDKDEALCIRLDEFNQILRRADAADSIKLEMPTPSHFQVTFSGTARRTFSLPVIDIEGSDRTVPVLTHNTTVTMPSKMLDQAVDDAAIVAESITFAAEKNKLVITAEGDLQSVKIEVPTWDKVKLETDGKANSKFAIEYLKKMSDGSKLSDECVLRLGTDYPLSLEYTTKDKGYMRFILAARVEND